MPLLFLQHSHLTPRLGATEGVRLMNEGRGRQPPLEPVLLR